MTNNDIIIQTIKNELLCGDDLTIFTGKMLLSQQNKYTRCKFTWKRRMSTDKILNDVKKTLNVETL